MKKYYLKFWRMKQELTQEQVAEKLGISRGHYRSIENGKFKASPVIISKFCEVFTDGSEQMRNAVENTFFGEEDNEIKE